MPTLNINNDDIRLNSSSSDKVVVTGNLGVGTTSPAYKLDVSGDIRSATIDLATQGVNVSSYGFLSQTLSGQMTFLGHNVRASNTVNNTALVVNGGWISSLIKQYFSEGITFHTSTTEYAAGATYPLADTERMRITSAGNVGIGTTTPGYKLEVSGDSYFSGLAHFGQTATSGSAFRWGSYGTAVSADTMLCMNQLWNGSGWSILESSYGTTAINLGSALASPTIQFQTGGANTVASTRMIILNNGNVGIGTTAPTAKFGVKLATATSVSTIANSTGWDNTYAVFGNPETGTSQGYAIGVTNTLNGINILSINPASDWVDTNHYSRNHIFYGGETERMRITIGGNVGIGTTSPAEKLQVAGNVAVHPGQKFGWIYNPGTDNNMYNFIQTAADGSGVAASALEISGSRWTNGNTAGVIFTHQTGGQIMTIMTGGNVGIGATAPVSKLQVNHSAAPSFNANGGANALTLVRTGGSGAEGTFGAGLVFSQPYLTDDASIGVGGIYGVKNNGNGTFGGGLAFFAQPNSASDMFEVMRITSAGNVGIGTTAPGTKLEVYSIIRVTESASGGILQLEANAGVVSVTSTFYGGTYKPMTFLNGGSERIRLNASGNLSIGNTNDTFKLDVTGTGRFTSLLQVNGPSGEARTDLQGISLYNANVDYRISFDSQSGTKGFIRYNVDTAGSSSHGHIFSAGDFSGGSITDLMIVRADGNVGIGTTAPDYKLEVSGNAAFGTIGNVIFTKSNGSSYSRFLYSGANSNVIFTGGAGGLGINNYADSTRLVQITDAGNVGIGTTSPSEHLSIEGAGDQALSIYSSTTGVQGTARTFIKLFGQNTASTKHEQVRIASAPGATASTAGQLIISTNNTSGDLTERLRIDESGNVGIGTTSPGYKLDVVVPDSAGVTKQNVQQWTQANQNTLQLNMYGGSTDLVQLAAVNGEQNISIVTENSGALTASTSKGIYIKSGGNVGIGTTSPTNKLHVNGGSIFNQDGFLYMSNQFPIVWGAAVSIEGDNVAGTLTLKTESSHRIFINNVGNVGVGTTSPTNRLTVTTATNAVDVLRLNNTGGDSGSVQGVTHLAINHFNSGTNPSTRITAYQDSTSGWPGGMYFSTRSLNTDSAPVERMRITSGGNVGIATATPNYTLHVAGDVQIDAEGNAPSASYVPDGGFGLDSLITSGVENVALGKPDVWLRIHVDGVAFVFPGYQEP